MEQYKLSDIAEVHTGPFGSQLHNKDYVTVGTPKFLIPPSGFGISTLRTG